MKTLAKLLIFQVITMFLLGGCSSDMSSIKNVKILTGFGPGMDFCLININEDGTVEYISCAVNNVDLRNEDIVKEVYEKKTIHLSQKNKNIISELMKKVIATDPIKELGGNDFVEIRALIEDKVYLSVYYDEPAMYYEENLANLTYKLVELSPIKVGGKQNPLKVPNQK